MELKGNKYGTHRVIEPKGVLTQAAWKIDNDMTKHYSNEIICDVISLNIDSASFTQIEEACGGDEQKIGEMIMGIVAERGKQQNPVTGSGGMFIGKVAYIGEDLKDRDLKVGDKIASLVSLSLTPLEHRMVTVALGVHALGLVEEQLDLFAGQDLGEFVLHLHRGNALGGIGAHLAGELKVGIKRLDRRDGARNRRGGLSLAAHPDNIAVDDLLCHLRQRHGTKLVQIRSKLVQIAQIGAERILGGMLFHGQIFFIL